MTILEYLCEYQKRYKLSDFADNTQLASYNLSIWMYLGYKPTS